MAHRNVASWTTPTLVWVTGEMAGQADMQRRWQAFRLFLRIIAFPQLFQIDVDQRQDAEQGE
ncbi:hypothetical protein D3C76_1762520 [compost metagenome]